MNTRTKFFVILSVIIFLSVSGLIIYNYVNKSREGYCGAKALDDLLDTKSQLALTESPLNSPLPRGTPDAGDGCGCGASYNKSVNSKGCKEISQPDYFLGASVI